MSSDTGRAPSPAPAPGPDVPVRVVGIGGSAGALPALMALVEAMGDAPVALVVVLHLAPDHESSLVEILQRHTPLPVRLVDARMRLERGSIYVIAPGLDIITDDGHVQPAGKVLRRPTGVIDLFFRSLATVHRDRAIGVVLSGTGRDGSLGLSNVKEGGGLTIAQGDDAEHAEMPQAAISTGSVDLVLKAADIGQRLAMLARFPGAPLASMEDEPSPVEEAPGTDHDESEQRAFQDVITALRVRTRHDFRHYKRGTVMRRLQRRMQVNQVTSVQAYRDLVRRNPEELGPLLADMLISVTNFFRDPQAFDALERHVVPQLMEGTDPGEEVRVWIPGCASGEESYSVAILLQEYADRMAHPPRVQVFASDINETALNVARAGLYPANVAADISDSRLLGYFERDSGDLYRVRAAIREMIVFARHNVLGDPPFSRVDLVCCRNLLIYLDRTAQAVALEMFAYALKPGGYLFLGNAESIDAAGTAFEVVDKEHRIYRLRPGAAASVRTRIPSQMISLVDAIAPAQPQPMPRHMLPVDPQPVATLHERAIVAAAPPSVLLNADLEIERVSPGAGRYVAFGEGTPTRNLLNNVEANLRVELRAALYRAGESNQRVHAVFRRGTGVLSLVVQPVESQPGAAPHWLVVFDESPAVTTLPVDAEGTGGEIYEGAIRRLEDENRSLKTHLQETLDRSAVSNEELKASNEELQAINEELRSAKEELETSKEELQSVNEELTTVNYELRLKVDEASRNNDDLRNLIEASEIATVFVDPGMRVKRFTPQASKLFALIPSDIGRPLLDVKSRLKYDEIVEDASAVFKQLRPVERSVSSVDDEHYFARILPYRTSQDKIGGAVLTFVNVTELRRAEDRVKLTEERLRDAIAISPDFAVLSTDPDGRITSWNEGAARMFGYPASEAVGQSMDILYTPQDDAAGVPADERAIATRQGRASDERWHRRKDGTTFYSSGVLTPLHGGGFLKIARDLSDSKANEQRLSDELDVQRRRSAGLTSDSDLKDRFLAMMSHELKQPLNLIQVNAELLVRLPETRAIPAAVRIGDTIKRAVTAQETIVNDLLDLSRVRTGKLRLHLEPTDIVQIVQRFAQAIGPEAKGKHIEVALAAPAQAVCRCDPVRVEQIVWNLLGNAIKFTPEGGRIAVAVAEEGGTVRIEVADTGIGIAPDVLPTVWELFSQAPPDDQVAQRRSGLGIGLALVRELVAAHGGRVDATSPGVGQGATFTVWLPAAGVAAPEAARQGGSSALAGRRVLLVDDDTDLLPTLAAVLEAEGADVRTAASGAEALAVLAEGGVDLLLSDLGMPGMTGQALIQRVRALPVGRGLRAIAVSGFGRDADVREALAAGFDAHLPKPLSIERLRTLVERLGRG